MRVDWYRYALTDVQKKSNNLTITRMKPKGGVDCLHNLDFMAHND